MKCARRCSQLCRRAAACGVLALLVLITMIAAQLAVVPAVVSRSAAGSYDPIHRCTWILEKWGFAVQYHIDKDGTQIESISGDLPLLGVFVRTSHIAGVSTGQLPSRHGQSFVDRARTHRGSSRWIETGAGVIRPCVSIGYADCGRTGRLHALFCTTTIDVDLLAGVMQIGLLWIAFIMVLAGFAAVRRMRIPNGRYCHGCGYELLAGQSRCPECGMVPTTRLGGVAGRYG